MLIAVCFISSANQDNDFVSANVVRIVARHQFFPLMPRGVKRLASFFRFLFIHGTFFLSPVGNLFLS